MSDILIVMGPMPGPVRKSDLAAVGLGKVAAGKSDGALDLLILGPTTEESMREVSRLGARCVYLVDHPDLEPYTAEAWAKAATAFLEVTAPTSR